MLLNQKIAAKIINHHKMYNTISEAFWVFAQIYNNKQPNIADQIYHHISTRDLMPPEVIANQLQSEFICSHFTLHPV